MSLHAKNATQFIANESRADWHDASLWGVRMKRDKAAASVKEWEELRNLASQIKAHTLSDLDKYLEEFEEKAKANGVQVHWAADGKEHNQIVARILKNNNATSGSGTDTTTMESLLGDIKGYTRGAETNSWHSRLHLEDIKNKPTSGSGTDTTIMESLLSNIDSNTYWTKQKLRSIYNRIDNNSAGFAGGGWTGAGGKYEVAGPVHRDEFVLTKEITRALGLNKKNASITDIIKPNNIMLQSVTPVVKLNNKNDKQTAILEKIYKKLEESEKHHKETKELNKRLLEENKELKKIAKVSQKISIMEVEK